VLLLLDRQLRNLKLSQGRHCPWRRDLLQQQLEGRLLLAPLSQSACLHEGRRQLPLLPPPPPLLLLPPMLLLQLLQAHGVAALGVPLQHQWLQHLAAATARRYSWWWMCHDLLCTRCCLQRMLTATHASCRAHCRASGSRHAAGGLAWHRWAACLLMHVLLLRGC